jgi:glutamine synthetase
VYSQRNRSASVRIPLYSKSPKAKRLEFRCPDPSCNPYLAFSAMLMAGLDGIQNKIEPPPPVDRDLYDLPAEELAKVPQVPGSLDEALAALEADHDFLLAGGVFTQDVIDTWVEYKRENEIDAVRLRPHPYEFYMYYDI